MPTLDKNLLYSLINSGKTLTRSEAKVVEDYIQSKQTKLTQYQLNWMKGILALRKSKYSVVNYPD